MPFTIPNEADAFHADQAEPDARDFLDILVPAFNGTGVIHGCAVTAQGSPDMTVAVAAGAVLVAGVIAHVTVGNVTITAANGTNPRLDLICVDNAGAKSAVAGTAAANPVFPDPAGKAVIAAVYVPATDTTIATNQITDKRVVISGGFTGIVVKTADETLAASTTFQDDDHLKFPIGASATEGWFFECFILYSAPNATMDYKPTVTIPSGATMSMGVGHVAGASLAGFNAMVSTGTPVALQNTSGGTLGALATLNGQLAAMPGGWVFGGGTAGNVQLQWAQNTSDAGTLTVKKGSFMRVQRLYG